MSFIPAPCPSGDVDLGDVTVINGPGAAAVNIQDGGNSITTDSLTQHAEDVPSVSGDIGAFVLAVRNDAHVTLTTTDLDYSAIAVDLDGAVQISDGGNSITVDGIVQVTDGGSSITIDSLSEHIEDTVHVTGDVGSFVLGVRNDNAVVFTTTDLDYSPIAVTDTGRVQLSVQRNEDGPHATGHTGAFVLAVRNDAGTVFTDANLDYSPISVDSLGAVKVSGQKNEDVPAVDGEAGFAILGVRNDTLAIRTTTDGDYGWVSLDSSGRIWVRPASEKVEDVAHVTGDSGSFILGVRNDNANSTLSDTNGDYTPIGVDSSGSVYVIQKKAGSATLANISDTASSVTLQASNLSRRGWMCFNDSSSDLYIKFGATASLTSFSVKVGAGQYYELPQPTYTGIIDGIWSADSTGAARVTELT